MNELINKLKEISSLSQIERSAFAFCNALTSVSLPNSISSIGDYAFECCSSLSDIEIPSEIVSIGIRAFDRCSSLSIVSIPSSTVSIGKGAFRVCTSLVAFNVEASNEYYSSIDGVLFDKEQAILLYYPAGKEDNSYTIPNSVASISGEAFWGCAALEKINIPESVEYIADYAFESCSSLKSITFPSSLKTLEFFVLENCNSLEFIKCEAETPPQAGYYNTFWGVDKNIPLYVPTESIPLYQNADGWNEFNFIRSIPEDVNNVASQNVKTTHKVIHDGNIYILTSDKTYTITGAEVK